MPKFTEVFSTTAKVVLALVIISVVVGLTLSGFGGLGAAFHSPPADSEQTEADSISSRIPKTTWDRGIAKAIREHCIIDGMDEKEVIQSFGEPTEKRVVRRYGSNGNTETWWTWKLPSGNCLKYDGDKCAEQEDRDRIVRFTLNGHVFKEWAGCKDLDNQRRRVTDCGKKPNVNGDGSPCDPYSGDLF
jgi:hypothetical protein